MPRLKNPNHEKLAREYVRELNDKGKVVNGPLYSKVYRNASLKSATAQGSMLLRKPDIKQRIQEIIDIHNSDHDLSLDLKELRQATKQVFDPEGNLIEIKDNTTRLGAVQTVLKTKQAFNDSPSQDNRSITFNIGNKDNAEISNRYLDSLSNAVNRLIDLNSKLNTEQNA